MNKIKLMTGLLAASAISVGAQEKPDIILIMTDQQRGDALGCAGNGSRTSQHWSISTANGRTCSLRDVLYRLREAT